MLDLIIIFLASPIDSTRSHVLDALTSWHGRFMVLAWCFALPLGVLIARFFKIMPSQDWPRELDNKTWWRSHLILQWGGAGASAFGLVLILIRLREVVLTENLHNTLGWVTLCLLIVQISGGLFRGTTGGPTRPAADGSLNGDHYDMTLRRKIFEVVHKASGYLALITGACAVFSGLWRANAPIWMWMLIGAWWIALLGVAVILQHKKRAVDTYQAIWGPSPELPGNKIRPIGFGIHRGLED